MNNICELTFPRDVSYCAVSATPLQQTDDAGGEATFRTVGATGTVIRVGRYTSAGALTNAGRFSLIVAYPLAARHRQESRD